MARLGAENLAKSREVARLGDEMGKMRCELGSVREELGRAIAAVEVEREGRISAVEKLSEAREAHAQEMHAGRVQAHTLCTHASLALAAQRASADVRLEASHAAALEAQYRALRAERKLADKQDQIGQLVELVVLLEEEKALAYDLLEDAQIEAEEREIWRLQYANLARDASADMQGRLEEADRDRQMAEEAQMEVEQEQELERAVARSEAAAAAREGQRLAQAEEDIARLSLAQLETSHQLASRTEELAASRGTVSERDESIANLETALSTAQDELLSTRTDLQSVQNRAASLLSQLTAQQHELSALSAALASSEEQSLSLQRDVEALNDDLVGYLALQETHAELGTTLERLSRTSSLAQADADTLARLNAELVGHSNPSQKIRHLDRLRTELAELKKVRLFLAVRHP